jgi:DNA modification methylase
MPKDKPLFEDEQQPPTPEEIERQRVREEYRVKLAEKLKDPEFRKIEGFPIGTDEAILALSDPPYYTACPNPFIEEWLKEHGKPLDPETDEYHREPFAADVSEGKNHPIYNAHSYHTKVPHRAIMRYILHYTEPGDVVYDGFCGTGMTGVAAQLCGDRTEVEALGLKVDGDGKIWEQDSWEAKQAIEAGRTNPHSHLVEPKPFSRLGIRWAALNDLSPAATFIASNYTTPIEPSFKQDASRVLEHVESECGWMYMTLHREANKWSDEEWETHLSKCCQILQACTSPSEVGLQIQALAISSTLGKLDYAVWSDILVCPNCSSEIVFWEVAVDPIEGRIKDEFLCSKCSSLLTKSKCSRALTTSLDTATGQKTSQAVQTPVLYHYKVGKKSHERPPHALDIAILSLSKRFRADTGFPVLTLPDGSNTNQPKVSHGLTRVHHFYTDRQLQTLSRLRQQISWQSKLSFVFTSMVLRATVMNRLVVNYQFKGGGGACGAHLKGTYYVSSLPTEPSAVEQIRNKTSVLNKLPFPKRRACAISTCAAQSVGLPKESLDFIFTDPPFGGNLNYSELNFMWEAWLGVITDNRPEAITNAVQKKGLLDYQGAMQRCFAAFFEALKPGRWMTVEFNNSANSIWNAIQESLERAGFVVADVRVLDKGQYSFKQITTSGTTKKDLVISCYKPTAGFIEQFEKDKGTPQGVKDFIEQHLEMLPVAPTTSTGSLESLAERTIGVLFDRMIAYHLVRGARIPLSASEFRVLLEDLCYERDGMYFLPSQVVRYDALKSRGIEVEQLSIFVRDEKSAVQWVRNELDQSPQTLGELTPKFMQASQDWGQHEVMPELKDLLHQYFIREGDENWVVPDPDNEKHLEEVRRKSMLREFQEYVRRTGQLKLFRTEAVLAGFAHCWETKQYDVIVGVCDKIPAKILQEIQDLVMFYDIAKERAPEKTAQFEFKWE